MPITVSYAKEERMWFLLFLIFNVCAVIVSPFIGTKMSCIYNADCALNCQQCNSAGANRCDSGQCIKNHTVAEDQTCHGQSVDLSFSNQRH